MAPELIDEAERPEIVQVPDVAVRLSAPVVSVRPLEAVKVWVEVNEPVFVVVMPLRPSANEAALVLPILIAPPAVPVPESIVTPPPTCEAPVELPPLSVSKPPVAAVAPESLPAWRVNDAPVLVAVVLLPGWKTKAVALVPAAVVISAAWPPIKV